MMKLRNLLIGGALLLTASCSNLDCPLDNVVMMQCDLYATETMRPMKLTDVLTIRPAGRDTVLLNQASGITQFFLPLNEGARCDTLLLEWSNEAGQQATDTLYVGHKAMPHFESVDCPACVFHTLEWARVTSHPLARLPLTADSVSIIRSTVNYDDSENLRIYLRSTATK